MVWKKDDQSHPPQPEPAPLRPPVAPVPEPPKRTDRPATIGPSIFIKGDLSGDEDLVIEGRVEGQVDLLKHNVTVGKNGRLRADVRGRTVIIEGEVDGNVFAQEQVILKQSGAVRGNLTAPRVVLEDGSRFKGSIDMEPKEVKDGGARPAAVPAVPGKSESGEPRPAGIG
jgi:cytoskeletal protein CcmA (bactofilin family)